LHLAKFSILNSQFSILNSQFSIKKAYKPFDMIGLHAKK